MLRSKNTFTYRLLKLLADKGPLTAWGIHKETGHDTRGIVNTIDNLDNQDLIAYVDTGRTFRPPSFWRSYDGRQIWWYYDHSKRALEKVYALAPSGLGLQELKRLG